MKNIFSILLFVCLTSFLAGAQTPDLVVGSGCNECAKNSTFKAEYCFVLPDWPGQCAAFSAQDSVFYYSSPKIKKGLALKIPKENTSAALRTIARSQKKISAEDILFIGSALKKWETEQFSIGISTTSSGLGYKILTQGTGPKPVVGKQVTVHYKGMLLSGKVFDSSYERGQPATFNIGVGMLIKGWDEGIPMFNEGSKIRLIIPPELGYGSSPAGSIPPNSTLMFDIEIIKSFL